MRQGDYAELKMKKVLCAKDKLTNKVHSCRVLHINDSDESLHLLLKEGDLERISLDSIYSCKVKTQECEESCTGRIKERFLGSEGKILVMQIENGFYKISIKSVDKQIV